MEQQDLTRFAKTLTVSDIEQKLAVPTAFVDHNGLQDDQQLEVTDFGPGNQDTYVFQLSIRGPGQYRKPVFQARGWRQFVRQNHLQPGDKIHFWIQDDHQTFGIQVERNFIGHFDHAAIGPN